MKQGNIIEAQSVLRVLASYKLPLKKSYQVYNLLKKLDGSYQFMVSEEQKYLTECKGSFNSDGSATFPSPDLCSEFQSRMSELYDMDVDLDITPVKLNESDLDNQRISPTDIYKLEGFVEFE